MKGVGYLFNGILSLAEIILELIYSICYYNLLSCNGFYDQASFVGTASSYRGCRVSYACSSNGRQHCNSFIHHIHAQPLVSWSYLGTYLPEDYE